MSDQVAPAQAAPVEAPGPGARPCKDGDAPPNAFAALLGVARSAAGPPAHAGTPARTAHAGGSKAEGDSSGQTDKTATPPAGALVAPTLVTLPVPASLPAHPAQGRGDGSAHTAVAVSQPAQPLATTSGAAHRIPVASRVPRPVTSPSGQLTAADNHEIAARETAAPAAKAPAAGTRRAPVAVLARAPRLDQPAAAQVLRHDPRALPRHQRLQRLAPRPSEPAAPARAPEPASAATPARTQQAEAAAPRAQTPLPRARVHELAESMHALVKIANRRGSAAARITLRPAELGGVQVRLRAHQGGISASLTAQTSAGAQALGASHAELRRSLESQGILVHAIDVQLAGDGLGADAQSRRWRSQTAATAAALLTDDDTDSDQTIEPSALPAAGGQVDVLA